MIVMGLCSHHRALQSARAGLSAFNAGYAVGVGVKLG